MDGAPLEHVDFEETWGEQPFGAPMPRAFRLSDAERIAARRLEGAAEGSLKEALATVIVDVPAEAASLGERLEKIAVAAPEGVSHPEMLEQQQFTAVPTSERDFGWFGAVPPAHAVPCFEEREPDMDFVAAFALPPSVPMPVPMPVPAYEATQMSPPSVEDMAEVAASGAPEEVSRIPEEPSTEAGVPAGSPSPLLALPEDPALEPIVTAYAASARLAADAAAASQALFELQRLLNQQMLEASPELSVAMEAHGRAGLDAIPVAQQPALDANDVVEPPRAPDPATDETLAPPRMIQQAPPTMPRAAVTPPPLPAAPPALAPEMPKAIEPRAMAVANDQPVGPPAISLAPRGASVDGRLRKVPSRPPAAQPGAARGAPHRVPAVRPPRQTRRASNFDVRGFAAGFALSGAIGVVLYFVVATS